MKNASLTKAILHYTDKKCRPVSTLKTGAEPKSLKSRGKFKIIL